MVQLAEAKNLIKSSQDIFIFLSKLAEKSLGAALSLFYTLKKLGKNVNFYFQEPAKKFQFLARPLDKNFTLSINSSGKEISEMRYEKEGDSLKIHLFLKEGEIEEKDVSLIPPKNPVKPFFKPELLISLGIQKKESLGDFFKKPGFFNNLAILNIDNQISNENFGQVNLIDPSFSLSELIIELKKEITEKESSSLFQILFLNHFLEKLDYLPEKDLYLVKFSKKDFTNLKAQPKDLAFVIERLKTVSGLPKLLILGEGEKSVFGIFYSQNQNLNKKILENFKGESRGKGILFFIKPKEQSFAAGGKESNLNLAKEKVLKIL